MSTAYPRPPLPHQGPGPTQPGTLAEQMLAIGIHWSLPDHVRDRDPDRGWQRARRAAMPHTREVRP